MPYIKRSFPQALDIVDPGVIDVYSSPTVFVNYQKVALWNAPTLGTSVLSQLAIPVSPPLENYAPNPEQINNYNSSAALALADPLEIQFADGTIAYQAQGNPPGPNTSDPNDLAGNADPTVGFVTPPAGSGVWGALESNLNKCVQEGDAGQWNEQGSPGNPNILNCYAHTGGIAAAQRIARGDQCPWCAAFVGTILQASGTTGMISFSVDSYYDLARRVSQWVSKCGAISIPVSDPSQWRRNDVCVLSGNGSHHVAFIRGVDLQAGRIRLAGGNQGDKCSEVNYKAGSIRNVAFIGRTWVVPPDANKPIIGTLAGGGAVKTR